MFRAAILFCAILVVAKGQTTDVSQCGIHGPGLGQVYPLPLNTYIRGCTTQPCALPQGQDAVIDIVFIAPRTIQRMTTAVTVHLGFVPIQYPLEDKAYTCNFLSNAQCPVTQNQIIMYTVRLPNEEWEKPVGAEVQAIELEIQDDSGTTFVCFRARVNITTPSSKDAQNATLTVEV